MNDAKQATPAAELERQICSATEPKNEREWWAHREIERLRGANAGGSGGGIGQRWFKTLRDAIDAAKGEG